MAGKKPPGQRKTRTREHVIADLAINYVERQVLLCGFSVERVVHDYGIDLQMFTYNAKGEVEGGWVLMQVKATDHLRLLADRKTLAVSLDREDLKLWLREPDPLILVVYDGTADKAFWLYVQAYFEMKRPIDLFTAPGRVTVRIPTSNRLNRRAIQRFADYRDHVQAQIQGRIRHHA